jgi:hypothetical protein
MMEVNVQPIFVPQPAVVDIQTLFAMITANAPMIHAMQILVAFIQISLAMTAALAP